MSHVVFGCHPERRAQRGVEGPLWPPAISNLLLRRAATPGFLAAIGVLRLRARPTRKRGGSEILCGQYRTHPRTCPRSLAGRAEQLFANVAAQGQLRFRKRSTRFQRSAAAGQYPSATSAKCSCQTRTSFPPRNARCYDRHSINSRKSYSEQRRWLHEDQSSA